MNKIFIIGNLADQPSLNATSTGKQVCNFTVAVNSGYGDRQQTTFFRVSAWERQAENCARYLMKGKKVSIIGTVSSHAYINKEGKAVSQIDISATEIEFLSPRADDPAVSTNAPRNNGAGQDVYQSEDFTPVETDELPF